MPTPEQNARLQPGCNLVYPDVTSLTSLAFNKPGEKFLVSVKESSFDKKVLTKVLSEYNNIGFLLSNLVGWENMLISASSFIFGKNGSSGEVSFEELSNDQEIAKMGSVKFNFWDQMARSWPRNALTYLDGRIYACPEMWDYTDNFVKPSELGDGGKVLVSGKTILVTKDVWDATRKNELADLARRGWKSAWLPPIDPAKQRYDFEHAHIDGHAALITGKDGRQTLLVASSYAEQTRGTLNLLKSAAKETKTRLEIIKDKNLPPNALNLDQYRDGAIAMTSGAEELEVTLIGLVGKELVFTTHEPLEVIPSLGRGGIRCLTNWLPELPLQYWRFISRLSPVLATFTPRGVI